jgi:hypothetical protein
MNVSLPGSPFRIKGELFESLQTLHIPFSEGMGGPNNGVPVGVEIYKPLSDFGWEPEALPAENYQRLGDGVKGLAHIPGAAVERPASVPRRFEGVEKLKVGRVGAVMRKVAVLGER